VRVGLLDDPTDDDWSGRPNRFDAVARRLAEAGHAVVLAGGAASDPVPHPAVRRLAAELAPLPLLTGLNHANETAPLTRAHDLVRRLAPLDLDLIIAPHRDGLAHGLAMARACGEGFAATRIALWADGTARRDFITADAVDRGLRPLVADALERATLARVDAVLAASDAAVAELAGLGVALPPVVPATLPPAAPSGAFAAPPEVIRRLVFVGRFDRGSGAVAFVDAVERLAADGRLAGRTVEFLGPCRRSATGTGAAWLGLRAAAWAFPFLLTEETDPRAALARLETPDTLAVVALEEGTAEVLAAAAPRHLRLAPAAIRAPGFVDRLAAALDGAPPPAPALSPQTDWPALVAELGRAPLRDLVRDPPAPGVSVVVLHKDRPQFLPHALASLPHRLADDRPYEILLVDNGSTGEAAIALVEAIAASRPEIRLLRLDRAVAQAEALRRAVGEARHGTVVFLDDDNAFAADGLERLSRGVAEGRLDVVVSTLEVFENDGPAPGPGVAELCFLGEAGSAGLFFNGFGDTALAIRRDLFLEIGGFPSDGLGVAPALDWVMLATAAGRGARIGVLQRPAVRYRRDIVRAAGAWPKFDRENSRSRVFAALAGRWDPELVARFAQKRHIEDV